MSAAPVTLEDFVLYHERSSYSISEEFGTGLHKHEVTVKLPVIHGIRGLHEIIPHLWNFNAIIQGIDFTVDNRKTLFAGSLSGITRDR